MGLLFDLQFSFLGKHLFATWAHANLLVRTAPIQSQCEMVSAGFGLGNVCSKHCVFWCLIAQGLIRWKAIGVVVVSECFGSREHVAVKIVVWLGGWRVSIEWLSAGSTHLSSVVDLRSVCLRTVPNSLLSMLPQKAPRLTNAMVMLLYG